MAPKTHRKPLRIIVCGASGRMGSLAAALALKDKRFEIAALVSHRNPPKFFGQPIIEPHDFAANLRRCDAVIDFTLPAPSLNFIQACAAAKKPVVTGTTGFTKSQTAMIRRCAKRTAIFHSPNFSLGMNVLFYLARRAAAALPDYDVSISEIHHIHKKDRPSGTALRLAQAVRDGWTQGRSPKAWGPISIVSQRTGAVIGDHTLLLAGPTERLELTHRAQSREAFARGALEAALWIAGRKPGMYDMRQLLNL